MSGVHDIGGHQGFGNVVPEAEAPPFASEWEGRVHALNFALGAWGRWGADEFRSMIEQIPPADYLRMNYYERWLAAMTNLTVKKGLLSTDEYETGVVQGHVLPPSSCLRASDVVAAMMAGRSSTRDIPAEPRFKIGDRVKGRDVEATGHTRLPDYIKGHEGLVVAHHGAQVFADTMARGDGEFPQHLYTVRFEATELWGSTARGRDTVSINLWEYYVDPVSN